MKILFQRTIETNLYKFLQFNCSLKKSICFEKKLEKLKSFVFFFQKKGDYQIENDLCEKRKSFWKKTLGGWQFTSFIVTFSEGSRRTSFDSSLELYSKECLNRDYSPMDFLSTITGLVFAWTIDNWVVQEPFPKPFS